MRVERVDNDFAVGAIVSGCLALVFVPIVLGPMAAVLAFLAKSQKQPLANIAVIVAVTGTVLGLALFLVVTNGSSS